MASQVKDIFSSKVSINMVTNLGRTVIMALVGLLMVPYYLGEFGLSAYAIIPLATSLTNYFIIISDSLSNAFSRYMVIAIQKGDIDEANRVFTTSVIGMGRCILVMLPVILLVSLVSPYIFSIGPSAAHDVQVMFLLIMVASVLISFGASLGSVYMAYNRMYITYCSRAVQTLSQVAVVLLLFTHSDPTLTDIGVSYIVSSLLMLVIMQAYLKRVCPTLRFSRSLYDKTLIREMGGLGMWSTIAEMGNLLFIQASLVVVNIMMGSEVQGTFSIATNIIMMVHTACTAVSVSAVPLVYRAYVNEDAKEMADTIRLFSKFVGALMVFPLAFLIIFLPEAVELWLGPGYEDLYPMLYVMLPAEVAICASSALAQVPLVFKKMRSMAFVTCLVGFFNIVSSVLILAFTDIGILGVCAMWVVSMLIMKVLAYPIYSQRLVGGGIWNYLSPQVWCYVLFAILVVLLYVLSSTFAMPVSWVPFLASFFVGMAVFFVLVMRFFFSRAERAMIATYLPGFLQRFVNY